MPEGGLLGRELPKSVFKLGGESLALLERGNLGCCSENAKSAQRQTLSQKGKKRTRQQDLKPNALDAGDDPGDGRSEVAGRRQE